MTNLKNNGLIIRHKKKYVNDVRETYDITRSEHFEIKRILENVGKEVLTRRGMASLQWYPSIPSWTG